MAQDTVIIPEKIYFKIGEVCEILGVQAHVLRYWETEFPMLSPQKNNSGQRSYRRRDVEIALRIKQLLYNEMFTIAGARKKLQTEQREGKGKTETKQAQVTAPTPKPEPAEPIELPKPVKRSAPAPFTPISREERGPALFEGLYDDDAIQPRVDSSVDTSRRSVSTANVDKDALKVLANHLLELREMLKTPPV